MKYIKNIIWYFLLISLQAYSFASVSKKTVLVPMRDGTKLSTDIYLPEDSAGEVPSILIRTNTNKESAGVLSYYFASNGYSVVVQDVRGRFASEGLWEPYVNEACDGYDTIEWIAKQSWCDGNVGMMGGSYLASAQCLAAKLKPPHLRTIIPYCLPADPFLNSPWENGIFLLAPEAWWVNLMNLEIDDYSNPEVLKRSQEIKSDKNLYNLPVIEADKKLFGREVDYWRKWLKNNSENDYWKDISYINDLKEIKIPVLLQSGWYDTHLIGTSMAWNSLTEADGNFVKMVIGPWNHSNQVPRIYASTRNTSAEGNIDLFSLYLRWFDRWLKGIDNGIDKENPVSLFIMNDNRWIHTKRFPPEKSGIRRLYPGSTSGANSLNGDGKLHWDKPLSERKMDSYDYDPLNPSPAFIYRNSEGTLMADSIMNGRNDILVFETDPADSAFLITGDLKARLYASSSCIDTDWFVYFYGVTEKGEYFPITHGCIRARFRNSFSKPQFLKRGKVYSYDINMWPTSIKIENGWKLRVEIASSDFPQYSRNLNTGKDNEMTSDYKIAHQKIYYKEGKASYIEVPYILPE